MPDAPLIASRYRVIRELGRGGMGVVYVVEHTRTGDQLALKLLYGRAARDPQSIERFKREARASARIKSEHVVKVVDADVAPELENAPFLVMELLNGTDLEKQVQERGRLPADEVLHCLGQTARALDKSHAVGIIHRDLKPENLFLHRREDGSTILKILDFGISKIVGGEASGDMAGAGMTSTGAVMGTPLYMAPEQARGRVSEIGAVTDVWAMGLIALYLLTGEVYWRANTVAELMVQILAEPLYAPTRRWPWLPRGIDAWFAQSCARDPQMRFPTVGQQIDALGIALAYQGNVAPAQSSSPWAAVPAVTAGVAATPPGARTTGAIASERLPVTAGRSRAPVLIVTALALLAAAGGTTAWVVQRRVPAQRAVQDPLPAISASGPASTASAAPIAAAMLQPAITPSSTPTPDAGATAPNAAANHPTPWHSVPQGPRPVPPPQATHPVVAVAPATAYNPAAP